MTRMIHIQRKYRIELTETITRHYVLEVQAASLEEAEEIHAYPLVDIERLWDGGDGIRRMPGKMSIEHAIENVEEI